MDVPWKCICWWCSRSRVLTFCVAEPRLRLFRYPDIPLISVLGSYGIGVVLMLIASGLAPVRMRVMAVSAALVLRRANPKASS